MRNIILTIATVLLSASLTAQGVFSNKTQAILEKVIQDYPNHFNDIKGELIQQTLQTTEYTSTVQLPGSASSIVTLSTHQSDNNSWTCVIFKAGNFEKARSSFQQIYEQLRNAIITTAGQKTFILSGQYESPSEEKKASQVVFSLLPGVGEMKKLHVELLLREEEEGWKILLSVNDKAPQQEVQGAVTVNTP
jgi:hypothetical protein